MQVDLTLCFNDPYFRQLLADDSHTLEVERRLFALDHLCVDVFTGVCVFVEFIAGDVRFAYRRHGEAWATKVPIFWQQRSVGDCLGYYVVGSACRVYLIAPV